MSPDIEWQVGDDAEQETIAQSTSPRRSRRSWIAVLIVVMLGAGLGMAYRSIPEPAPRPTPTPSPTPQPTPTHPAIPAKLFAAIDGEAQALADGDADTLHGWQGPDFVAWGRPGDGSSPYSIVDFKLRPADKAGVDIRQYRNGRWFRETRFYQWADDRWQRSDPGRFFWSQQTETFDTPHFHTIYAVEDRNFIQPILAQLEQIQARICTDLGCNTISLTTTLQFDFGDSPGFPIWDNGREIHSDSPRVMGVYEDTPVLGERNGLLIQNLAYAMAQRIAYGESPEEPRFGAQASLFGTIAYRAAARAANWPDPKWLPEAKADLQQEPLSSDLVWTYRVDDVDNRHAYLTYMVLRFIEQEYGAAAVAEILRQMATARFFPDLIEKSLGVPFAKFDQKWQAWVQTNLTQP